MILKRNATIMLCLFLLMATLIQPSVIHAASGSSIPTVDPDITGRIAAYHMEFTVDNSNGDIGSVVLQFPGGMLPSKAIPKSAVKINGNELDTNPSIQQPNNLILPIPSGVLGVSNEVQLVIDIDKNAGIRNPSTPAPQGSPYQINFSVDGGSTWIASVPFTLRESSPTSASVIVSPNTANQAAAYTIQFQTSSTDTLDAESWILLTFNAATGLPASVPNNKIKVNGYNSSAVQVINGNSLKIPVPSAALSSINSSGNVKIEIPADAGIRNPVQTGNNYTIQVSTSADTKPSTSFSYSIGGSSISPTSIVLSDTGKGKTSQYNIQFRVSNQGRLLEGDQIYLQFPSGFTITSSNLSRNNIKINDKTLSQNASFSSGTLTITVPGGLSVANSGNVKLTVNVNNPSSAGSYTIMAYTSSDSVPVPFSPVTIGETTSVPTVSVNPNGYNESGQYSISFKTSPNGAISGSASDYIEVVFPSGTSIPSRISESYVQINGFTAKLVQASGQTVKIYLPNGLSIAADQNVNVLIASGAGIKNPSASTTHRIQLRTSKDSSYVYSSYYTTIGGTLGQGTNQGLKLSSPDANAASKYEITYRTSSTGALKGGEDEISILFLNSVKVPDFIDREYIRVNSTALDSGMVRISNNTLTFRVPSKLNIGNNQSITITIDEKARILHPEVEGTYYLYVYTTKDTATSYQYEVKGRASYAFYVEPNYDTDNQIQGYSMTFKTGLGGTLKGGYDWIEITLPKSITRQQLLDNLSLAVNGYSIDINKVQLSGQTISFFVPDKVDIASKSEVYIDVYDPNKILNPVNNGTVVFKIKTSRDTAWTESNPVNVFKKNTTNSNQPNQNNSNQGNTPTAKTTIKLYLDRKDTYVNGVRSTQDLLAAPYVHPRRDGYTMVPVRFISETLGATVSYDERAKKITIINNRQYIILTVNSDKVLVQGKGEQLPVPVEAKVDGITFVPIRYISEWLGFTVDYNPTDRSIILQK